MILPTGRSRIFLLGTTVVVVLSAASFLVFKLGVGSVASWELPVVHIGQSAVSAGASEEQPAEEPAVQSSAQLPVTSSAVANVAPETAVSQNTSATTGHAATDSGSSWNGSTESTVREFVQEDVRVQDDGHSHDSTDDSRDGGGSSHRPSTEGRR
jgi:hypothetical protein